MKAVCWEGEKDVQVKEAPQPTLLNPRDAIIRVTSTAICGSDLHLYGGFIPTMEAGDILGHEFMGVVMEVGPAVKNLRPGDRVIACRWDRYTSNPLKSARKGRIFVDYLRNARGATAIAPYSARARDKAPVAAPVSWEELKALDSASRWHVADAAALAKRANSKALAGWGRADQSLPEL